MKPLEEIIRSLCPPLEPLPTDVKPNLTKIEGIKAVLFDVYGTLFVSGSGDVGTAAATDTAEAMAEALAAVRYEGDLATAGEIGKDTLKAEVLEWHTASRAAGVDFPEVNIAKVWKKVIEKLRKEQILQSTKLDIDPIRQLALEYECRVNPVWPMPESLATLQTLKERGLVLGIVSNAQFYTPLLFSAFFNQTVKQIGFDPDSCVWSYKELKGKPSDALFPKAGKYLKTHYGISPEETVYVGNDMLNDIYTANRAGCKTVLFAGDRRSLRLRENDERCRNVEPDAVITLLEQLNGLF